MTTRTTEERRVRLRSRFRNYRVKLAGERVTFNNHTALVTEAQRDDAERSPFFSRPKAGQTSVPGGHFWIEEDPRVAEAEAKAKADAEAKAKAEAEAKAKADAEAKANANPKAKPEPTPAGAPKSNGQAKK